MTTALPTDSQERKETPICTGVLDYFPAALAEIAKLSRVGNLKHNGPDSPLTWARGKSSDHADCIIRHLAERGTLDTDGLDHAVKVAWRGLALLQEILESRGAAPGRASVFPTPPPERIDADPIRPSDWTAMKPPGYKVGEEHAAPAFLLKVTQ